jgi:hypothetical protein
MAISTQISQEKTKTVIPVSGTHFLKNDTVIVKINPLGLTDFFGSEPIEFNYAGSNGSRIKKQRHYTSPMVVFVDETTGPDGRIL